MTYLETHKTMGSGCFIISTIKRTVSLYKQHPDRILISQRVVIQFDGMPQVLTCLLVFLLQPLQFAPIGFHFFFHIHHIAKLRLKPFNRPALQLIPLRMGLAYLTLWALRPRTLKLPWKDELMFILIGITGGSVYFFLQNTAAAHTSAANVSILVSMSPILTVILAQLFSRKGEKLGKLVYIGALVAIVGVVLVVLNGTLSFHLSPLGDLLALAAALMWAVYSILVKKYTERYDNFLVTRRVFLWAFLTSLPLVLLTDGMPSLSPLFSQPKILISWLFLGVFGNAVCFAIWNIAFKSNT